MDINGSMHGKTDDIIIDVLVSLTGHAISNGHSGSTPLTGRSSVGYVFYEMQGGLCDPESGVSRRGPSCLHRAIGPAGALSG